MTAFILMLLTFAVPAQAQAVKTYDPKSKPDINDWSDSVVRIISEDGPGDGIQDKDGTAIDFGTGFVINDAGYIVTNNHVASRDKDKREQHTMCVAIETVTTPQGKRRYLHRTTPIWFSPADDLAILRCSSMHAKPIPLDLTPPRSGERVHSLGYPLISDMIAASPHDTEAQVVVERSHFISALAAYVNPHWNQYGSWDITNIVNQNRWATYCTPTRSDGGIRETDLMEGPWGGTDAADVPEIQHNLEIQPGNSGGPLLSDRGGVVGVVGDGMGEQENGSEDISTNYATTIAPVVAWLNSVVIPGLDAQHHYYRMEFTSPVPARMEPHPSAATAAKTWAGSQTVLIMIILGLLVALILEFVILWLTWNRMEGTPSLIPHHLFPSRVLAREPVPGAPGGPLAGQTADNGHPRGRGLFFHVWGILKRVPLRLPSPKSLAAIPHQPWVFTAGASLLVVGITLYLVSRPLPPRPHSSPSPPVVLSPPAGAVPFTFSPAFIAALRAAPHIEPNDLVPIKTITGFPPASNSQTDQEAASERRKEDLSFAWGVFWRIAVVTIAIMILWRLIFGVTWHLKISQAQKSLPG